MTSAALDQVFSVPLRHLWSTNFSGEQTVSEDRPLGLARFVGDEPNLLLKYFVSDDFSIDRFSFESQWPLVLFGASGTGKTSLGLTIISDLADRLNRQASSAANGRATSANAGKPLFLTALDFDRRFRSALETDSVLDFRKRLIGTNGLIIDDLHRLVDKPAAQNELVLILDEMYGKNRPIVITMNVSPQLCGGLSDQLISRLSGGLSLPVNPPGRSARREIIRDLARINQVNLTDDAAGLLVSRLNVTVPKLNHVFAQIKTALRCDEESNEEDHLLPVDAAKLTRIFKNSDSDLEKLSQLIVKRVAAEFNLKVADLRSKSRKQSIVMARGVAIYLNRNLLGTSFLKIGTYFGNRDHSTIMHAFRKIEKLISSNQVSVDAGSTKKTVSKLEQQLAEQFASQINFV